MDLGLAGNARKEMQSMTMNKMMPGKNGVGLNMGKMNKLIPHRGKARGANPRAATRVTSGRAPAPHVAGKQ